MTDPQPSELEVKEDGSSLLIRWRWRKLGLFLTAMLFAGAFDGVIAVTMGHAVATGADPMASFDQGHLVVAFLLSCVAAVGMLNRTDLEVRDQRLFLRHGPVPFLAKDRELVRSEVKELFCGDDRWHAQKRHLRRYSVGAILRDGTKVVFMQSLVCSSSAEYVKAQLEKRLGLGDGA